MDLEPSGLSVGACPPLNAAGSVLRSIGVGIVAPLIERGIGTWTAAVVRVETVVRVACGAALAAVKLWTGTKPQRGTRPVHGRAAVTL